CSCRLPGDLADRITSSNFKSITVLDQAKSISCIDLHRKSKPLTGHYCGSTMTKPPHFHVSQDGDFAAALNASLGGWSAAMGLHFVRATADEVIAELQIGDAHRQAYGIVHGGVH